jgi:hypothetical protein
VIRKQPTCTLKIVLPSCAQNFEIFVELIINFHIRTMHLDFIKVSFNSPTDAQVSCLKNNTKIYIKTAPTCFSAITIITESII